MSLELETRHKDWKNLLLKDCIIGKGSYGANVAALNFDPLLPRYLRITDIDEQGNLIAHNAKSINLADAKNCYLEKGNIVFSRSGSVGKTYLHRLDEAMAHASNLIRFSLNQKIILPKYLFLFTQSQQYKNWIKNNAQFGTQPSINAEEYSNLPILIPPLPEQQKIANILGVWDNAIEKVSALISLYEKYLSFYTILLIFGAFKINDKKINHRMNGRWYNIPNDWKYLRIKDIARERSEFNINNNNYVVLSCTKYHGFIQSLEYFKRQIFSNNLTNYKLIYRDDFGFPSNHIEEGSIGVQNLMDKAIVSPIYTVFSCDTNQALPEFIFYLLKTKTYIQIFRALTSSSVNRRGKLRWSDFSNIEICLPSIAEQKMISNVLNNYKSLINGLYLYKKALQSQKQGLIQKLLTGEWRV